MEVRSSYDMLILANACACSEREPEPEIEYYKGDQAYFPFQKGIMIDAKVDKDTWSVGIIVKVETDQVCGGVL